MGVAQQQQLIDAPKLVSVKSQDNSALSRCFDPISILFSVLCEAFTPVMVQHDGAPFFEDLHQLVTSQNGHGTSSTVAVLTHQTTILSKA